MINNIYNPTEMKKNGVCVHNTFKIHKAKHIKMKELVTWNDGGGGGGVGLEEAMPRNNTRYLKNNEMIRKIYQFL